MFHSLATPLVAAAASLMALAAPARAADSGPVIVIPSRPGVPIIINGRDASYAVVEGDWGLSRPGAVPVTIVGPAPYVRFRRETRRNYPRYGVAPERGRNEVEPPPDRLLPEPAESFSRSWSTQSDITSPRRARSGERQSFDRSAGEDAVPATIDDPQAFNPPVIVAPRIGGARP
jgi:hypothetical protein